MSLDYNGLVKDVSNIMVGDYKKYLDDLDPDDTDVDTPYDIFYNQCLNEFVTRAKRLNRKPSGNY